jgi:eukaryotic-like serine/threonine-protein kinase
MRPGHRSRRGRLAANCGETSPTPTCEDAMLTGKQVGPYRVVSKVGEGGMGEVYRARDTRLNRDVAIKVLPSALAGDLERLSRFEREAQVLASLNHPHVAQVYGLEEADGVRALVMEFVEGVTLAEVIRRAGTSRSSGGHHAPPSGRGEQAAKGPGERPTGSVSGAPTTTRGLPIDDALAIARQIADALEAAHEKGIVHRDLKPANIVLRPDGTVKVLDFGLAKAIESSGEPVGNPMDSPTFSVRGTEAGVILGTAAYMAPEQARGRTVDKRADIWAFGVVLYEMLTGSGPFDGSTSTDVLAAVITRDPDWSRLPANLPEGIAHLLRRLLEKDPKRRLRDIGDARLELEQHGAPAGTPASAPPTTTTIERAARRPPWGWMAGLALALAAGTLIGRTLLVPRPPAPAPVRFEISQPVDRARTAMAPDGSKLVLVTAKGLAVRDLDRLETRDFPGTEGAESPFWSGDSTTIVYGAKGRLWRLAVAGGTPALITTLPDTGWDHDAGGAWLPDGTIVFTNGSSPLLRVPAAGGDAVPVVEANAPDDLHFHQASALPDGRGVLFVTHRKPGADTLELWAGGERLQLLRLEGSTIERPVYSPTGHILFTRFPTNFGLWAVPFSLDRLQITGEPFLVTAGAVGASISRTGHLAYLPVSGAPPGRLTWVDRQGTRIGRIEEPGPFDRWPALSPDGTRAAISQRDGERSDVWAYHLKDGAGTRLTSEGFARLPVWAPDGRSIVYVSMPPGERPVMKRAAADGSGVLEELGPGLEPALSSDGESIFYSRDFGIFHRPLGGGEEVALVKSPQRARTPRPSPDGRFIAYQFAESETLRPSLVVSAFPSGTERAVIPTPGGNFRWSADGRRLFYSDDSGVLEVDVQPEPRLRVGVPRRLFSLSRIGASSAFPGFDVSGDGTRFLFVEPDASQSTQRIVIVLNFRATP